MSNFNVVFPGMMPGIPLAPYPYYGGHVNIILSPTLIFSIIYYHPFMTCPLPTLKAKGWLRSLDESNFLPSSNNVV